MMLEKYCRDNNFTIKEVYIDEKNIKNFINKNLNYNKLRLFLKV